MALAGRTSHVPYSQFQGLTNVPVPRTDSAIARGTDELVHQRAQQWKTSWQRSYKPADLPDIEAFTEDGARLREAAAMPQPSSPRGPIAGGAERGEGSPYMQHIPHQNLDAVVGTNIPIEREAQVSPSKHAAHDRHGMPLPAMMSGSHIGMPSGMGFVYKMGLPVPEKEMGYPDNSIPVKTGDEVTRSDVDSQGRICKVRSDNQGKFFLRLDSKCIFSFENHFRFEVSMLCLANELTRHNLAQISGGTSVSRPGASRMLEDGWPIRSWSAKSTTSGSVQRVPFWASKASTRQASAQVRTRMRWLAIRRSARRTRLRCGSGWSTFTARTASHQLPHVHRPLVPPWARVRAVQGVRTLPPTWLLCLRQRTAFDRRRPVVQRLRRRQTAPSSLSRRFLNMRNGRRARIRRRARSIRIS